MRTIAAVDIRFQTMAITLQANEVPCQLFLTPAGTHKLDDRYESLLDCTNRLIA